MIVNYIKKQREHHHKETTTQEIRRLLSENNVEILPPLQLKQISSSVFEVFNTSEFV